jgi:hypothetical protein
LNVIAVEEILDGAISEIITVKTIEYREDIAIVQ